MNKKRNLVIVIPGDDPPQITGSPHLDRLRSVAEVILYQERPNSSHEKIERVSVADIMINTRSMVTWPADVLHALPKLKMIATCTAGVDSIDMQAAKELGITVCNQPGRNAPAVAEHMFGLMLSVAKNAVRQTQQLKKGIWTESKNIYLRGKTLGIIGTGYIGQEMARLGQAIGMNVIAWTYNPSEEKARKFNLEYVPFKELLSLSDVISLHVKLTADSKYLIGEKEFGLMKPSTIFVNGARGDVVDMQALVSALKTGAIVGAALDVFDIEPLPNDHAILACDNIALTPHHADQTPEAMEWLNEGAVDNILAYINGTPNNVV